MNPLILLILDRSGSMSRVERDMVKSFNTLLDHQSTERGNADLSVFTFNHHSKHYIKPINFKQVGKWTNNSFNCGGATALYDTVVKALNSVPSHYTDVCVMIQTDGQDNESTANPSVVANTIQHKLDLGWQFLYMGADSSIVQNATEIGLGDHAVEFKRDSAGIEQIFNEMSRKVSNFRAALDNNILTN